MIRIAIVDDDRNMLSIVRKNIEVITGIKDSTEVHEYTDAKEVIDACDECVYIPMESGSESLNASIAASVCMWELYKTK